MSLPRHIAIIMDGNGRWAAARGEPRHAGHKAGLEAVRRCIEHCSARGIEALTLFAFSSENWRRPGDEVARLMGLFVSALEREIDRLDAKAVRLRFIGARERLSARLNARISAAEARTAKNRGLALQVAVSYGGRWDIVRAARRLATECAEGRLRPQQITERRLEAALELAGQSDPDLFIRTGGERRISNFLLWNLAYTELYFTDLYWPDFDTAALEEALAFYERRDRRFGRLADQERARAAAQAPGGPSPTGEARERSSHADTEGSRSPVRA